MKKKFIILLTAAVMSLGVLAGCGNSATQTQDDGNAAESTNPSDSQDDSQNENPDTDTAEADASSGQSDTITVTDARGEVEIPADPQRIVDLSGNSDILSVYGYSVIGTANSDAYDYTVFPSYLEDILKGAKILGFSMQDTMDIEGILELEPDLIIISSVQEKMYEQLKEIAPTVMIELAQINWRDDINAFAEIMGKEDIAAQWLSDYDKKASDKGTEIKAAYGEETTYLAFLASGGQLYVFDAAGIGSVMYEDMGLAKPANMPAQDNISLPVISYEGLAELDPDYIFVVATEADMESLRQSSIYNSMRAVEDGNVIELPSSPYFNMGYSCIGREVFLEEFTGLMEQ